MDIVALTESWLTDTESDQVTIRDITPAGYVFDYTSRTHSKGRGVARITRKSRKIKIYTPFKVKSFENVKAAITRSGFSIRPPVIYRFHPKRRSSPCAL